MILVFDIGNTNIKTAVFENDKLLLVENGVPKTGFADKKTAKQYGIPHTGPAYHNFTDVPGPGGLNLRIKRSDKTIKELLNGRCKGNTY